MRWSDYTSSLGIPCEREEDVERARPARGSLIIGRRGTPTSQKFHPEDSTTRGYTLNGAAALGKRGGTQLQTLAARGPR